MCEHSHHITHHKPKEENTKKKFLGRVLGPDGSPHHISPSHIREHKEEVLGPSSWAGWLTTPHLTITHHKPKEENTKKKFLGRVLGPDGILDTITHHKPKEENTKKKFLGRVLGPDGSSHHISPSHIREHKEEVLGPSSWAGWLTTPHLTITHHKPKEENTKKKFLGRVLGPDVCVSALCVSTMCEHSMCVSTLTISHITSRKKRTQRRSSWAEFLGRMAFSPRHTSSHLTTSDITSRKKRTRRRSSWAEFLGRMAHHTTSHQITHHKPKEENTKKKFLGRVLGPDAHHTTSHQITHHKPKEENAKKKLLGRVLGPDGSPHHISPYHTSQAERRENKEEVLGPSSWAGWHSHHITHHHIRHHKPKRAKKYEFYCENVVQEHPRTTQSTRITTKNEHRRS